LVVGSGQTSREVASAAVDRLDAVGATVLGALLNRAPLDRPGQSYLPYYHREYPSYYAPEEASSWFPTAPDIAPSTDDGPGGAARPLPRA
jgi:hypothetical protein